MLPHSMRYIDTEIGGVVTRKSLLLPLCSRLTFVCQIIPQEVDDGMFTTHTSGMKIHVGLQVVLDSGSHYDLVIPSKNETMKCTI